MTQKHITIVAFCGPSGSGKTELVKRLMELYPDNLSRWKQATTRAKRGPGDDYVFMTKPMYDVVRSTLTCRTEFNGNFYGTFPEPTGADTAVLTIADAMGLADLIQDVANHNNHVNAGHKGKLGEHPVRLVKILMSYDLTSQAEIERRGADRSGTRTGEFLQQEEEKLRAVCEFDTFVDTTGGAWADPVEFFSDIIWPQVVTPFGGDTFESLYAEIEHQLIEVGEGCRAVRDLDGLRHVLASLKGVADYVNEWVNSEPEPDESVDAIDAVLSAPVAHQDGAAQMDSAGFDEAEQIYSQSLARAEAGGADQPQYPSDYLNDRTPESAPGALVEAEVAVTEVDVSETPAPEVPLTEEAVVGQTQAAPTYEEAIQAADAVEEAVNYAALKPYGEIFSSVDFTDWMLENTIGLEAFENESMFKTIFSQYVSAHGGNPNGIEVSSQATKDGKGGRVVEYTAHLPDGTRYGLEFNERIKRAVNYGPR